MPARARRVAEVVSVVGAAARGGVAESREAPDGRRAASSLARSTAAPCHRGAGTIPPAEKQRVAKRKSLIERGGMARLRGIATIRIR